MRVRPAALVALSFALASSAADFPVAPGAPIADAVAKARAVIGDELFDYLLVPPLQYGDRDTSQDNAFG